MPRALSMEEEVKIFQLKCEVGRIVEDVAQKTQQYSNLTDEEKRGLESLKQRVDIGEIVCTVTDKSGRWACDSIENYKKGCEKLVADEQKTPRITQEQHQEAEQEMNAHGLALMRMLELGDRESGKRLRNAITAVGTGAAPMYGLRKDHKPLPESEEQRIEGPKMRPICGAKDSLTKRTSYLLCKIITPLLKGEKTHCDSTDGLIKEFKKVNKRDVKEDWVVGSLDVESLYPSLDIPRCVEVIKRKLEESNLVFENLTWKEISLYLQYNLSEIEIADSNFETFLPTRRFNRRPPKFTRSGSNDNMKIRHQPWIFPQQPPDDVTK